MNGYKISISARASIGIAAWVVSTAGLMITHTDFGFGWILLGIVIFIGD